MRRARRVRAKRSEGRRGEAAAVESGAERLGDRTSSRLRPLTKTQAILDVLFGRTKAHLDCQPAESKTGTSYRRDKAGLSTALQMRRLGGVETCSAMVGGWRIGSCRASDCSSLRDRESKRDVRLVS